MNRIEKLKILGAGAKYDACAAGSSERMGICHAALPDGRCISLLKVLLTNRCKHDCRYCENPICKKKTEFEPAELANLTEQLYLRNYVEGLFLSSGITDEGKVTERMIECASILRKGGFTGYIHLKLLPGVGRSYINQICEVADRVSINLEAPSASRFSEIAPTKDFKIDVMRRIGWLSKKKVKSGITTQFVVGAAKESDMEIVQSAEKLYRKFNLRRAYFSAFSPVKGTALENAEPTPLLREHRLYQTDWLMRVYRFSFSEVEKAMDEEGFLSLSKDPKEVISRGMEPVDPKNASYRELLRVPGIGPVTAKKIVRKQSNAFSLRLLKKMGVNPKAMPFLKTGHRQVKL